MRPAGVELEEAEVGAEDRLGDVVDRGLADRPVRRAGVVILITRSLREQIDWARLREETASSPFES